MNKNEIIFEVLQATGLNWSVSKQPLFFGEDKLDLPDSYATVRSDSKAPLGIVKGRYEILQNKDTVETIYKAGEEVFSKDLQIEHPWDNAETLGSHGNIAGGSLKGGKAVFVQLELPTEYIGKSDIKRFITVTNHHDGSKSLGFGTTNQVVCCANTFAIANKDLSKIRHTASMNERVDTAVTSLRSMIGFETQQMEVFNKASNIRFDNKHIEQVLGSLFGADKIHSVDASSRLKNQVKEFSNDMNTSIDEQGETLWALFNAVTRYTNHTRNTKDKDYSLMFGTDAQINQKAFNLLKRQVGILV
jgi:phage/plasmid-like protein (TIGR03299 family)